MPELNPKMIHSLNMVIKFIGVSPTNFETEPKPVIITE